MKKFAEGKTQDYFKDKKQVWRIWCSRVDLIKKKTTMKCLECDFGFCRGGSCWYHHVALDSVPAVLKKGTKKRKLMDLSFKFGRNLEDTVKIRIVTGWRSICDGSYSCPDAVERWTTPPMGGGPQSLRSFPPKSRL